VAPVAAVLLPAVALALAALAPDAAEPAPGGSLHTRLLASVPTDGDTIGSGARDLVLEYNEPVDPDLARVRLHAGSGAPTVTLEIRSDPGDPRRLLGPLPALDPGGYRIAWRVVSDDGHPVEGSFVFHVRPDPTAVDAPGPPPPPAIDRAPDEPLRAPRALLAPLRGLAVGTLGALAGLLGFAFLSGAGRAPRGTTALAWAAAAAAGLHLAAWISIASPTGLSGEGASAALATLPGRLEAVRAGLALLALWAAVLARRPRLAAAFAAGAVLTGGVLGHASTISPAVSIPLKTLHVAAASAWLGGLVWLAATRRETALRDRAGLVSTIALAAVVVLALTGAAQAVVSLERLADLHATTYGRLLLTKVAGLSALVAFGAVHRRRHLPALDRGGDAVQAFRRTLRSEIVVMAGVILVAGLLASVPVPGGPP